MHTFIQSVNTLNCHLKSQQDRCWILQWVVSVRASFKRGESRTGELSGGAAGWHQLVPALPQAALAAAGQFVVTNGSSAELIFLYFLSLAYALCSSVILSKYLLQYGGSFIGSSLFFSEF